VASKWWARRIIKVMPRRWLVEGATCVDRWRTLREGGGEGSRGVGICAGCGLRAGD
jgi:hypothetical protein